MMGNKRLGKRIGWAVFGLLLAMIGALGMLGGALVPQEAVYAVPGETTETSETTENTTSPSTNTTETTENTTNTTDANSTNSTNSANNTNGTNSTNGGDSCKDSLGAIGWLVCPTTGAIAGAVDFLYSLIQDILVINPIMIKDGEPTYEIWKYCLGLANIVFIIFLLVVIYSQITGFGISNYGVKKALPKLIVVAVLVNLSFLVCAIGVDLSNIVGSSLRGVFDSVEEAAAKGMTANGVAVSGVDVFSALVGGSTLAIGGAVVAFETGAIWLMIPMILGALVAVVTGLITIALRQAVVVLLVMIAPLAVVAYMLPNTEGLFKKWRKLLVQMLVFYPMFSLLFGASSLAGFAIIASAQDGFGVLLGMAVQIFPLFFSWKLMQMSGTFLGDVNAKMRGLTAPALAAAGGFALGRRMQTKAYRTQYGRTPYSRLQKYLDNRKALREKNIESLQTIRKSEANIYAQRKIGAGYDGTKALGTKEYLKANKYTRTAKDAANAALASETAEKDTKHALSNYGDYFVDKRVRDRVAVAKKAKDDATLKHLERTDADYRRATIGAQNFLEYSRAQMTEENDSEADFNFMVSEFLDANSKKDKGKMREYQHYIESSAGGLGEIGSTRVLGKIIARAASVESNQRRDINIIAAKYPPDKGSFRSMLVGYLVDDDGYAINKEGERIEKIRGWLLANDPNKLVLWDRVDENGPYFDWKDVNGNFVTRVHKNDKSTIKELLSNFDAPINDPINNLYGVLAGIKEGDITGNNVALGNIGLAGYQTTVGRALMSFKEKNAAFSPMVKEMISRGYIQNYAQEYLAYLDSLNKATKPGAWNVQDGDAIDMFAALMDPDKWEEVFPTELIRGYRNVNGEPIYGIRIDENGNQIKVPAEEATREELMERIKGKYIIPAAHKITMMMSKTSPNTADNQKAGTIEKWKKLKEVFDTKWGEDSEIGDDPYKQSGDMRKIARDMQQSLYTLDENGVRVQVNNRGRGGRNGSTEGVTASNNPPISRNHHVVVDEMHINSNNDPDGFARDFAEYCDNYPELTRARRDFDDFVADRGYMVTEEELYDFAISLLDAYTNLD